MWGLGHRVDSDRADYEIDEATYRHGTSPAGHAPTVRGPVRAIPVGGLLAVGFLDEHRVVVGSHSGFGVFDATTGTLLDRVDDANGEYGWFREPPPIARYVDTDGRHSVLVAGLWGGQLPSATADGWVCQRRASS